MDEHPRCKKYVKVPFYTCDDPEAEVAQFAVLGAEGPVVRHGPWLPCTSRSPSSSGSSRTGWPERKPVGAVPRAALGRGVQEVRPTAVPPMQGEPEEACSA